MPAASVDALRRANGVALVVRGEGREGGRGVARGGSVRGGVESAFVSGVQVHVQYR